MAPTPAGPQVERLRGGLEGRGRRLRARATEAGSDKKDCFLLWLSKVCVSLCMYTYTYIYIYIYIYMYIYSIYYLSFKLLVYVLYGLVSFH